MTRDISGRLYVWKYSWPSTELHCGAIKLDWNDNVVASLGNWKSTQCEAANNTAQHRKAQGWQLLAYSLIHQLLSLVTKMACHRISRPVLFTPWLEALYPLGCITTQGPASLLSGWPLLRRALPSAAHITIWRRTNWRCVLFYNS